MHEIYKLFLARTLILGLLHVMLGRKLMDANSMVQQADTVPWQDFQRSRVVHKFCPLTPIA